jgi:hypothetical protein
MPPSATTTACRKKRRASPKKATSTAPKKPERHGEESQARCSDRATRAAPKKTSQSSVTAMQAQINTLRAEVREARD